MPGALTSIVIFSILLAVCSKTEREPDKSASAQRESTPTNTAKISRPQVDQGANRTTERIPPEASAAKQEQAPPTRSPAEEVQAPRSSLSSPSTSPIDLPSPSSTPVESVNQPAPAPESENKNPDPASEHERQLRADREAFDRELYAARPTEQILRRLSEELQATSSADSSSTKMTPEENLPDRLRAIHRNASSRYALLTAGKIDSRPAKDVYYAAANIAEACELGFGSVRDQLLAMIEETRTNSYPKLQAEADRLRKKLREAEGSGRQAIENLLVRIDAQLQDMERLCEVRDRTSVELARRGAALRSLASTWRELAESPGASAADASSLQRQLDEELAPIVPSRR
ncbi:MAG: hypothetical protein IPN34_07660 [Planctomycetes bacterium]|nr:hypothetical protein [Planctomycetota bacterium]